MNQIPRVAAVHDISGFGRCSMTVALPVLSAMGMQVCPLPTAYLSAQTAIPVTSHSLFRDMTPEMEQTALSWNELHLQFSAVYSGFLGSARQIGILRDFCRRLEEQHPLILVDPVMGDHGKIYSTYTDELCRAVGELTAVADIITPNLTEAAFLLGEPYDPRPDGDKLRAWLERLSRNGGRSVVITGVSSEQGRIGASCFDRTDGSFARFETDEQGGRFSGTGDLFASVVLGSVLRGGTLPESVGKAVDFVALCAGETLKNGTPPAEGVAFEPLLGRLL